MPVPFDAGNFSNDIDAGINSGDNSATPLLTFLYETGNVKYNYFHIQDAYISSISGNYRNYYQFNSTLDYKLIPDTGYVVLNSGQNIIYTETSGVYNINFKNFGGETTAIPITAKNEWRTINHTYNIDDFNPDDHLLIVYNQNNQDSTDIKDYYVSARNFSTANILALTCNPTSGDITSLSDYTGNIRAPIVNWIQSNSNKPIKYVVLLYDLPFRVSGKNGNYQSITGNDNLLRYSVVQDLSDYFRYTTGYRSPLDETRNDNHIYATAAIGSNNSLITPNNYLEHYSIAQFRETPILVTHVSARNKTDVSGYITHIVNSGVSSGYYLKGNGQNNTYIITESSGVSGDVGTMGGKYISGLNLFCSNSPLKLFNDPQDFSTGSRPIMTGGNLAGFLTKGTHHSYNYLGNTPFMTPFYATDGTIKFTGYNWYIMASIESYNGVNTAYNGTSWVSSQNAGSTQASIFSWVRPTAFFSSNYENCPIGCVGHTNEPGNLGNNFDYFVLWNSGLTFIEAAYRSRNANSYPNLFTCMGDPLLLK